MQRKEKRSPIRWGWVLVVTLCTLLVPVRAEPAPSVELVAHDTVDHIPAGSQQLRAIFSLNQQHWPDGSAITVVVLESDAAAHRAFCRDVLELLPFQLTRQWHQKSLAGSARHPEVVSTPAQLWARVKSTPGAIGYLPSDWRAETTASASPDSKAKPPAANYPW
ncbi:type 2 periplasmic-binding domain-containing protein [Ferrimonas marina]|uniref:PBP superfamily domain-containing protein n=1 Tax=Ferrimonas marina TaxID=299255 RepID=A0A1M5VW60_9GAMM|nr:hypothetical protein [Ferrimonas marina]SHH79234.1 hypothetical protein SAMN02745129_3012 [Ferrimonas marina]